MAPYDDWNALPEEEEELQDEMPDFKRDVILFAIDCSESMLAPYPDPAFEQEEGQEVMTCKALSALEAAVAIQKRKVLVGPSDSAGVMVYNTSRRKEGKGRGGEIKQGNFIFQKLEPVNAPSIQELIKLIEEAREDPSALRKEFPPLESKVAIGDVFTSCNWVLRDGAPKTATKRVFIITDDPDPHAGSSNAVRLATSARTTLEDLAAAGVSVEPFFIAPDDDEDDEENASKGFDVHKFWSEILPTVAAGEDEDEEEPSALYSIARISDLLAQMRFREVPKRALFSIPFHLGDGFTIGVKGYGLVTEQKKGTYKYFVDLGDRMEVAGVRTVYLDEDRQAEVDKRHMLYGMGLGASAAADDDDGDDDEGLVRTVRSGRRPFFTAEEVREFRTLGLEPGIKLLGFKDRTELLFEDNVKHSTFIYPDEMSYSGSRRTFSALLKAMLKKDKIALVRALTRRNSTPYFCALLPQEEKVEEGGWNEPPGFHLIPLPFADDIRAAPIEKAYQADPKLHSAARAFIDKLSVKNGAYPPDTYPNPALAFHGAQLEAAAFRAEFDEGAFEDVTVPKVDLVHKRAGALMHAWKDALDADESANVVLASVAGTKRKADVSVDDAEIRSKWESGALGKLRVDQLKEFLKSKSASVSGKKGELVERVGEWLESH